LCGEGRGGGGGGGGGPPPPRARFASLIPGTALIVAAVLALTPLPAKPPGSPTVTFLDVGEGAATLVQIPDGPTILIDAGPLPLGATLRAHGVKKIDLLVLSHGHADHVAGLADVIGRFPIGTALLPRPPTPSTTLDDLSAQLTAVGCRVTRCTAPLTMAGAGYTLEVLPTLSAGEGGNQGENDCALVALVDLSGAKALVPGDAEGPVLTGLGLPPVSVVELPHHGSAGGLDQPLLQALHPALAVISVGQGNRYGHPTAEMLDLVAGAGVPCLRTDQSGDVVITAVGGGFSVGEEISGQ
jgi:competence protein ComEC